ncbi:MAG: TerB family tellurite resistance protein [Alishewanella agri]|nr:TerB family tellurite resistance protein [Alishewanella agri]
MFNFLKNLLEKASEGLAGSAGQQAVWQNAGLSETQFMAVVLLLQLSHADFDSTEQEQQLVLGYLQREYQLAPAIAQQVLAQANQLAADATCLHAYTSKLKVLSETERLVLLNQLWQLAWADGSVDPNEEMMLRKVADLLFIRHSDFIKAKLANQPA